MVINKFTVGQLQKKLNEYDKDFIVDIEIQHKTGSGITFLQKIITCPQNINFERGHVRLIGYIPETLNEND